MNENIPPDDAAMPEAMYGCGNDYCAAEITYPADMLYWVPTRKSWFCYSCISLMSDCREHGLSLAQWLKASGK